MALQCILYKYKAPFSFILCIVLQLYLRSWFTLPLVVLYVLLIINIYNLRKNILNVLCLLKYVERTANMLMSLCDVVQHTRK